MKAVDTLYFDRNVLPSRAVEYAEGESNALNACKKCPYVMDLIGADFEQMSNQKDDKVFLFFLPKLKDSGTYLAEQGFKLSEVFRLGMDMCRALDFCHSNKILHRDVKPDNIFYSEEKGCFVLGDFGFSRLLLEQDHEVTIAGSIRAPEIAKGKDLKGKMNSDLYSLGLTLQMLIAKLPEKNLVRVCTESFYLMPQKIQLMIEKATAEEPEERYQNAKDFLSDLKRLEPLAVEQEEVLQLALDLYERGEKEEALELARDYHYREHRGMSCMYAFLLGCKKDYKLAMEVLHPLLQTGNKVALCLYSMLALVRYDEEPEKLYPEEKEGLIQMMRESADQGFSVAQYYVGRWYTDGQMGIPADVKVGMGYIFSAMQQDFLPALRYFKDRAAKKVQQILDVETTTKMMEIVARNEHYSDEKFSVYVVRAIAKEF